MNVSFHNDGNSEAWNTNEVQFIGQDFFIEISNSIYELTLKVNELSKLKDSINIRNLIMGGRDHYWKKYDENFVAEKPGRVEEDWIRVDGNRCQVLRPKDWTEFIFFVEKCIKTVERKEVP
jgi:hypothetical protein